jgi:Ca2+-binding RTX toxin-like protein
VVSIRGRDVADGFAADFIYVSGGGDSVASFGGDDTIFAPTGNDTIDAGDGNDRITYAEAGGSLIFAGAANDTVSLFAQTPVVDGGSTIDGGAGDDRITAGDAADSILGQDGDDTIIAGGGADTIHGGSGNDFIQGGAGNDRIFSGPGADTLSGGAGADWFIFDDGDLGVFIDGQLTGFDTVLDFNRAQGDKFDLRRIDADTDVPGNQFFWPLLPASDPTPIGAGSLRYTTGPDFTVIEGSTDSDADMEFRLVVMVPGYTPIVSDFILASIELGI